MRRPEIGKIVTYEHLPKIKFPKGHPASDDEQLAWFTVISDVPLRQDYCIQRPDGLYETKISATSPD